MLTIMTAEARHAAKRQLLADLQDGYSVPETQARASLPWHPATIYRLRQRLQADPALALEDGRHGHPVKLRGEVRDWLVAFCQATPHTPSHVVQAALQERFGLLVSISQLNRVRAALGLSSRRRGKKQATGPTEAPPVEARLGSYSHASGSHRTQADSHCDHRGDGRSRRTSPGLHPPLADARE